MAEAVEVAEELAEAVEVAVEVALLRPGGAWAEAAEEKAAGAPRHSAARTRRGGTRRRGEGMAGGKEMSVGAGGRGRSARACAGLRRREGVNLVNIPCIRTRRQAPPRPKQLRQ